ncbi:unnamed protein product [Eruca vesicaria subsp. sativa]|uniref:DUF4378 domain-containing protein n=1 Tax=Eruca vesicaria subsp. sativa TaxID=29727 RepID=A0ABC8KYX7_ERUVS|nr:unnamed protein product [Eruca vesicaria subsp. sativa]
MERRRSPRNSKSPGTVIFPKSPLLYEGYKSGCGWKLINFFDFRHVKPGNKRLSSEKKPIRDSAGNVYTKSQLDLLKRLHDKCQCNDRIVEGENSCKPKTRRRSLSSEREGESYESKPAQGLLEREIKRSKNLSEPTSLSEVEKTDDKAKQNDLKNVRERKKSSEIKLQVCMNETAETLISSKAEEKGKDRSKQFMEALDILSSNKDLFITLLQDPNSLSAKNCQDLEQGDKSPSVADDLDSIVLLKPRLSSSERFKHLAKKVKLVVGSNKDSNTETKPECSGKARETEAFAVRNSGSPESPVFRRKKRVESDVFKLNIEKDVLPRRFLVERQQERSNSSPVYEFTNELSSLQTKLKERRQKLEKRRLWSLDTDLEVFDPYPHNSSVKSLDNTCTSLERIYLEEETVEEKIGLVSFDDRLEKDSVHEFVKKVLEASRLNWTNLMARCNEETSLLDEFSHGNHNNNQLLLVLDYADEILREINRQDIIKFWPFLRVDLREEDLIQETLRRFDWSLLCCDTPRTLDQIIETDLVKPSSCLWSGFGGETEGVVSDVVENILQRLVLDISHELKNNALQSILI